MYSTCTIDSRENQNNVKWFVENHDFETVSIDEIVPRHGGDKGYVTLLQGVDECDGFFISKFRYKIDRTCIKDWTEYGSKG